MKFIKKTEAVPVAKAKALPVKKVTPAELPKSLARIQALCIDLNKKMDGLGHIGVGSDVRWLDPARIRTGILGFDVLSSGGLPRRSMTHLWGPFSVAKTTTLLKMMANCQRRGGNVLYSPSETFFKDWGRKVGCWIQYSQDEYRKIDDDNKLAREDKAEVIAAMRTYDAGAEGLGQFALLMHPFGDALLEGTAQAVRSGVFDIVGVDSLAACKPTKVLEENEVGDDERGSGKQIQMLIQFGNRINSAFSTRYDAAGNASPKTGGVFHNETAVVCINQAVQDQTPVMGPMRGAGGVKYQPSMGKKLLHYWNLSVEFRRGYLEDAQDEVMLDGDKRKQAAGIDVVAKCDKSKVGVPYRTASWHLYTREFNGHMPGDVDAAREARVWGVQYDVIEAEGAWYTMPGGRRVNGKDKVDTILREEPELRAQIEEEVIARCRR